MDASDLKVVRLYRYDGDSKAKAFVDVAIGDYVVKGFRVVQGKDGLFLGMPREKSNKDGKWYSAFIPVSEEAKQNLTEVVLSAYQQEE